MTESNPPQPPPADPEMIATVLAWAWAALRAGASPLALVCAEMLDPDDQTPTGIGLWCDPELAEMAREVCAIIGTTTPREEVTFESAVVCPVAVACNCPICQAQRER